MRPPTRSATVERAKVLSQVIAVPSSPSAMRKASFSARYLETQYHFVREYVQNGTVCVNFVKSTENYADVFTKNVSSPVLEILTDYLCMDSSIGTGECVTGKKLFCSATRRRKNR